MKSQRIAKKQGGVVMLEGLVAVAIFAFGVLAMVGMQAATKRATSDAKYRVDASLLVNQAVGLIWAQRDNAKAFDQKNEAFDILPGGKRLITVNGQLVNGKEVAPWDVTVTVTWQLPGESKPHTHSSLTRING